MSLLKNIKVAILLSAALMMLIYSGRPHHHHHNQVCFSTTNCEDEGACETGDGAQRHGWDHLHGHPVNELCKLNGYYIIPNTKSAGGKAISRSVEKPFTLHGIILVVQQSIEECTGTSIASLIPEGNGLSVKTLIRAMRAPPSC